MSEEEKRPRLELLKSGISVELCNPVKEKINQIEICGPNIEIKSSYPEEKSLTQIMWSQIFGPYLSSCDPGCRPTVPCTPDGSNWDKRDWIINERMATLGVIANLGLKETEELKQQINILKTDIQELKQQANKQSRQK